MCSSGGVGSLSCRSLRSEGLVRFKERTNGFWRQSRPIVHRNPLARGAARERARKARPLSEAIASSLPHNETRLRPSFKRTRVVTV